MSQRYNDNTKRPKLKENQLRSLKIYTFCQKIQQRVSGPGEGYISIYENTLEKLPHLPPKSRQNFPQWFQEGSSWGIVVT